MLRSLLLLLISTLALALPAVAQPHPPTAYFPLEMGNSWTYFYTVEPPNMPVDTVLVGPIVVESTADLDDQRYTFFNARPLFPEDSVRMDESGRVFARQHGTDVLMFDFTAAADSVYTYTTVSQDTFRVTVQHTPLAETEVGSFSNCVAFDFMLPGAVDADHFYTFCPEIGLVAYIDGMGTSHALFEATINGAKVTSRTREEQPNETTLWAGNYPNPFQETTTFSFRIPQAGHASLQLYTLQGRLATTVASGVFGAGMHQIRWDASDFVSGIYFFVIQTDRQRFARPVHLIR